MENQNKQCIELLGILKVCVGDRVEIVVKGLRGYIIEGIVSRIGLHGLVLKTSKNRVLIKYSEIRLLRLLGSEK